MIKGLAGPLLLFAVLDAFFEDPDRSEERMVDGRDLDDQRDDRRRHRPDALEHDPSGPILPPDRLADLDRRGRAEFGKIDPPGRPGPVDRLRQGSGRVPVPTSLFKPLVENSIISIVILAVLGGMALRKVKNDQIREGSTGYRAIEDGISAVYRSIEIILGWAVELDAAGGLRCRGEDRRPLRLPVVPGAVGVRRGRRARPGDPGPEWSIRRGSSWSPGCRSAEFWAGAREAVVYAHRDGEQPGDAFP